MRATGCSSKVGAQGGRRMLLTAHTLDDQAETVLFRMARGSGLAGLARDGLACRRCRSREGRGLHLVRPLLDVPKSRLIATLEAAKVRLRGRSVERDPRFTRPRLRELMPLLAREGLTRSGLASWRSGCAGSRSMLFEAVNEAHARLCPSASSDDGPTSMDAQAFVELLGRDRRCGCCSGWSSGFGDEWSGRNSGKLEALYCSWHAGRPRAGGASRPVPPHTRRAPWSPSRATN